MIHFHQTPRDDCNSASPKCVTVISQVICRVVYAITNAYHTLVQCCE